MQPAAAAEIFPVSAAAASAGGLAGERRWRSTAAGGEQGDSDGSTGRPVMHSLAERLQSEEAELLGASEERGDGGERGNSERRRRRFSGARERERQRGRGSDRRGGLDPDGTRASNRGVDVAGEAGR